MPPREQLAARLRERGNALFGAGNYSEAASVNTVGLNQSAAARSWRPSRVVGLSARVARGVVRRRHGALVRARDL